MIFTGGLDVGTTTEICRACWHQSYRAVIDAATIDGVFDGAIPMTGSWLARRAQILHCAYATVANRTAAFIEVGELANPECGEVMSLYVLPEFQGQGLGRQLWERGCQELLTRGNARLEVWAISGAAACTFYRARGCREFDHGSMWIGDKEIRVTGFELALP